MLNSAPSASVTKSIIRNMEMNGTLETRPTKLRPNQELLSEEEDDDDDDEEEDEEGNRIHLLFIYISFCFLIFC